MLSYLADLETVWGPFRLFGYLTIRSAMALLTSLLIGFTLAPYFFRKLRELKAKQSFRCQSEVGRLAELHSKKKDTPTMGGLLIYLAIVPSVILWARFNVFIFAALVVYTGLTLLGFADDYLKITRKNSKGVSSRVKLLVQAALTVLVIAVLLITDSSHQVMRELWVPFYKYPLIEVMPVWFMGIFFFFVMAGSSNGINLTDGIDGLAIGCTIPVVLVYAIIAYVTSHSVLAEYLNVRHIPEVGELTVICTATLGAAMVFLWYNAHPAEVFMGDTGSLSLGGLIGAIAFMTQEPFTLVLIGGIFVMEAMSVIIQVGSFKLRGKRVFSMAPIHHHFELKDWHENKVVIRFWVISLMFAIAGLSTLKLR